MVGQTIKKRKEKATMSVCLTVKTTALPYFTRGCT